MIKHNITISNKQIKYTSHEEQHLLAALEASHPADFMVGCRQGGCGYCRIQVLSGTYRTGYMSSDHVSEEDIKKGIVLACRTFPTSDLTYEFLGLLKRTQ